MARPGSEHPTELELAILKTLWEQSPRTVEEVREALAAAGRVLTHSSVITMLNIMVSKRYLARRKQGRAFAYRVLVDEQVVGRRMLTDLVDRVFAGSTASAMLELLETSDVGPGELEKIRRLINQKARKQSS